MWNNRMHHVVKVRVAERALCAHAPLVTSQDTFNCMHISSLSLALLGGVLVHRVQVFAARVELVGAADSAVVVAASDCAVALLSVELEAPVQSRAARVAAAVERPEVVRLAGAATRSGCPCRAGVGRAVRDPASDEAPHCPVHRVGLGTLSAQR